MKSSTLCAAALTAIVATPVQAADPEGRFALRSIASINCGQVVQEINARKGAELQGYVDQLSFWLGGYLTLANRVTPGAFDVVPFVVERDVLAIIVNRCEGLPPETNFEAVTFGVINSLSAFAVKAASPVQSGESMIPLREAVVIRLQERLVTLGHLKDKADGVVGKNTENAIREFQKAQSMPETGKIDIDTVLRLLEK